jgi:hypothetical protein
MNKGYVAMGVITAWDRNKCIAEARYDMTVVRFHSTSYQGINNSWPVVGKQVEIVFNSSDMLVSVHEI